jgi:hypothetical protein
VLAVVVLAATRVDAAMAAPVPCKAAGGGHLNCQFYVAGNGRSGGSPVQAASAAVVGYLHQGTNSALSASQSDSMYKQMVCHTFWGVAHLGGPTWDFESWRPDVSSWKALRVREHSCNWDRSAWTDTTKCVELRVNPSTCLSVHGGGLDVGSVRLGVRLNSRQSSYGHWQLWVPSQPENTSERLVNNRSFLGKNVWGQTLKVDRSFRAGQRLCVKWWRNDKPGSGRWSDRGKACVTISR